MKRALFILVCALCILTGCGPIPYNDPILPPEKPEPVQKILTTETELVLIQGETKELKASLLIEDVNQKLNWRSDTPSFELKSKDFGRAATITGKRVGTGIIILELEGKPKTVAPVLIKVLVGPKAVSEKPTPEKPATKQTAKLAEKPKTEKPKTEKPAEKPKTEKPADKPKIDPPTKPVEKPKTEKPKTEKPKLLQHINLSSYKVRLEEGARIKVYAKLKPAGESHELIWESDNSEFGVAARDKGAYAEIMGKKRGTGVVIVSPKDPKSGIKAVILKVEVIPRHALTLNTRKLHIRQKESADLRIFYTRGAKLKWTASRKNWIKITTTSEGIRIQALNPGKGYITATASDGRKVSAELNVFAPIEMSISHTYKSGLVGDLAYINVNPRFVYDNNGSRPNAKITWSVIPLSKGGSRSGLSIWASKNKADPEAKRSLGMHFNKAGSYKVVAKMSYQGQSYEASCKVVVSFKFRKMLIKNSFAGNGTDSGSFDAKKNVVRLSKKCIWTVDFAADPKGYPIGQVNYSTTFKDKLIEIKRLSPTKFAIKRLYPRGGFLGLGHVGRTEGDFVFYADKVGWQKTITLDAD